jgi:CubicO group peptidase (beta-lactamase class C family)
MVVAGVCRGQDYLSDVVERARKGFDVPGIAVAIVKDGDVVLTKGYGMRKMGDPAPVTPRTLFRIASNTKAFTAAALATLVDEKRIRWDDPVIQHLPTFQMYDPYVTREMTIRDLLTHRSGMGLGAGDLMFFPPSDLGSEEIIRRLRFIKPATSFRSAYAYDNLLYLVAGQIIPAVTGKSWDDYIRERIFTPLGMANSFTSMDGWRSAKDVATPHSELSGKLETLPQEDVDNTAPAGAIASCAADLAKWMNLQLAGGTVGKTKIFSAERGREMWSAQTILPIGEPGKDDPPAFAAIRPNFSAYGLGWSLRDYRGKKLVAHNGGLSGFVSRTALIPEIKLGVVVLTNQEEVGAFSAIVNTVLDHYLGAPEVDWVSAHLAGTKKARAEGEEAVKKSAGARRMDTHPSLAPAAYAGRYRDAWYGDVRIEEDQGKLYIFFTHSPDLSGELEHWQYDTFVARWRKRSMNADAYVTFTLGPDGKIDEMKMKAVSPLTDFSFDFHDLLFRPVAVNVKPM